MKKRRPSKLWLKTQFPMAMSNQSKEDVTHATRRIVTVAKSYKSTTQLFKENTDKWDKWLEDRWMAIDSRHVKQNGLQNIQERVKLYIASHNL